MRSSKELAARLRFDRFPRPDFFRRRYFVVGLAAVVAGLVGWGLLGSTGGNRAYLPGPVTPNHATFGDRCENCHDSFGSVSNGACTTCHPARDHSEFVTREADCRECHVEHLGEPGMLAVSNDACTGCHGNLASKQVEPAIARRLPGFAAHPEFTPKREGVKDVAAVRFNHRLHRTSKRVQDTQMPPDPRCEPYPKMACGTCHKVEETGRLMRPITYDKDCACCHEQVVTSDVGSITAPHTDPETIRRDLATKLAQIGVERADTIFSGSESVLPGVRGRDPIDDSKTLREFQTRQVAVFEGELYKPFDPATPLFDNNTKCFLCHDAEAPYVAGGELPVVRKTGIPARWLRRAEFAHRKHEMLDCKECHGDLDQSSSTGDVNLPKRELCETCHHDDASRSAGTGCILCHLYHDTSKDLAARSATQDPIPVSALLGHQAPVREVDAVAR